MRFVVRDGDGLLTFTSGFAYRPSGPPPSVDSGDTYEHISGPWYVWTVGGAAD
jgi:hypothetical protein